MGSTLTGANGHALSFPEETVNFPQLGHSGFGPTFFFNDCLDFFSQRFDVGWVHDEEIDGIGKGLRERKSQLEIDQITALERTMDEVWIAAKFTLRIRCVMP
jgi:hypothetical protein